MNRIDAHIHCWHFDAVRDAWITPDMSRIQQDFQPTDIKPLLLAQHMNGCVLVQSDQSTEHNQSLLETAAGNPFIRGIVGWTDLCAENVTAALEHLQRFPIIRGFRHILQAETDRAFMLTSAFLRGIAALGRFDYTYDILVHTDQLSFVRQLVQQFPEQPFVLDHLGKPNIRDRVFTDWKKEIETLGRFENLHCKVSGIITEADWQHWTKEECYPYLDAVVESFGPQRLLFGSDWPMCLLAGTYDDVLELVEDYFRAFSETERAAIFGGNAVTFYRLAETTF